MKENILKSKSFDFAVRIVESSRVLQESGKEYVLSKQLLRSGTSVGAMVRESEHAESKADFIHKLSIAQKEINESIYWIELLEKTSYLTNETSFDLHNKAVELLKILTAILKTAKANNK